MSNKLSKIPTLKVVEDTEAAQKLRDLIKDADDGLRRVVKCGLYIEWVAANLPHGQFLPWLKQHAPDVNERSVYRWRTMAKSMCEWAGLKFDNLSNLKIDADKILYLPVKQLPTALQKAREKMDEVLDSARTPKQLFLDMGFKQGDLDVTGYPKAKRGRVKGQGGASKEQRAAAAEREEQARLAELAEQIAESNTFELEIADATGLGKMDTRLIEKFITARETSLAYARRVLTSRTAAKNEAE